MNTDSFKNLLKSKSLTIPGYLLDSYEDLKLDFKELVFLSIVINELDHYLFNAPYLAERLKISVPEVMNIIASLCDKKLIEINVKKVNGKMEEVINLDTIYSKLLLENIEENKPDQTEIYNIIEKELGRTLSPIEYETISEWLSGGISEDLIKGALKEAVLNGVTSLKYIDKILHEWIKKGYKTTSDVKRKNVKEKQVDIPDIDWLDLDE